MGQGMIVDNVRRGARLLDEKRPGWATDIDKGSLDIISVTNCILGQLYGLYGDGRKILDLSAASVESPRPPAIEYGFVSTPYDVGETERCWIDEINARTSVVDEAERVLESEREVVTV